MISHTTLGTNDILKAEAFFDELLPFFNGQKFMKTDRAVFYSFGEGGSKLAISKPFNGDVATAGNGTMVAFSVGCNEAVISIHKKALSLGASNEGDPGPRYDGLYFGAYFRDLDGNKFAIFHLLKTPDL